MTIQNYTNEQLEQQRALKRTKKRQPNIQNIKKVFCYRNQQERTGKTAFMAAASCRDGQPTAPTAVQTVPLRPQVLTLNEQIYIKKEQQV